MNESVTVRFREEQAFRAWWAWLLIGLVAVLQWWGFIQQIVLGKPWGNKPAPNWVTVVLWLLVGIGLPFFFLYAKLIVTVTDAAVDIRFRPLTRRTIPFSDIKHSEARTYAPLREYGGWGIAGHGRQARLQCQRQPRRGTDAGGRPQGDDRLTAGR